MGPGSYAGDGAQAGRTAGSSIVADVYHQKTNLIGRIPTGTASDIGLPVKEAQTKEPRHSAFYAKLRQAYHRYYKKPGVIVTSQKKVFKWWKKASFTCLDTVLVFPSSAQPAKSEWINLTL